jgi:hypothetical protein
MSFIGDVVGGIVNAGEGLVGEVGNIAQKVAPAVLPAVFPELGLVSSLLGAAGGAGASGAGALGGLGGLGGISSLLGGAGGVPSFGNIGDLVKSVIGGTGGTTAGGSSPSGSAISGAVNGTVDDVQNAVKEQTDLQRKMALFSIEQTILQSLYAMLKDLGKGAASGIR